MLTLPDSDSLIIAARSFYLIETDARLKEGSALLELLEATLKPLATDVKPSCWILPRVGTHSPWSSKVYDIAGVEPGTRIDHGIELCLSEELDAEQEAIVASKLYDPMTQSLYRDPDLLADHFQICETAALQRFRLDDSAMDMLTKQNQSLGLALCDEDLAYLVATCAQRSTISDAELMMFAQVNSEHCRHKVFNASWMIDGQLSSKSLFQWIQNTHKATPGRVLSAYKDNAAVLRSQPGRVVWLGAHHRYRMENDTVHAVLKVETHNHPTAVAPFEGAATGCGGEIRDEAATGIGARSVGGMVGYMVSELGLGIHPWHGRGEPHASAPHLASAKRIMLEAPLGAARYNNEFGRPLIVGFFRSLESRHAGRAFGYHKPVMIAGGLGHIRAMHVQKKTVTPGCALIVLGGPGMMIGLGGGAASSLASGSLQAEQDFASVQRADPEMQRRVQEVINRCAALGDDNPILSIHDVGAGGLSNAVPEVLHDHGLGADIELRSIPCGEPGLSPMAIWCNESQERYVLALRASDVEAFEALCLSERAPVAVIGTTNASGRLRVNDALMGDQPVDIDLAWLFGSTQRRVVLSRREHHHKRGVGTESTCNIDLQEACRAVLSHPSVASKHYLITIADRSIGGLVAQEPCVGPWQIPVNDAGIVANGFDGLHGEALAVGERPGLALYDPVLSARMCVGEALTNLLGADVGSLFDVSLSANWMVAAQDAEQALALYDAVEDLGGRFCIDLGVNIPVGKDSTSMQTRWEKDGDLYEVSSPMTAVITAVAPVARVQKRLTPVCGLCQQDALWVIELTASPGGLLGTILEACTDQTFQGLPAMPEAQQLRTLWNLMSQLKEKNWITAYHDRSDGGLWVTLCEMAFASGCGMAITLDDTATSILQQLFDESLGVVVQVLHEHEADFCAWVERAGLLTHRVATLNVESFEISLSGSAGIQARFDMPQLHLLWSEASYRMQGQRGSEACAMQEHHALDRWMRPPLHWNDVEPSTTFEAPALVGTRPIIGILREQGVQGHTDMAAAFIQAGFEVMDISGVRLRDEPEVLRCLSSMAISGGFSFADALGAGRGWAASLKSHDRVLAELVRYFERETLTLGVCNGAQMLSHCAQMIPGAACWPRLLENDSEVFESRWVQARICEIDSPWLEGLQGRSFPIMVAHGEGRVEPQSSDSNWHLQVALQYVDAKGEPTQIYPFNPNGSKLGCAGFVASDGRVLAMMPHPERLFHAHQSSVLPYPNGGATPWFQLFSNAYHWLA